MLYQAPFKHIWEGEGAHNRDREIIWDGGLTVSNWAKAMVSVLHEEQEYKVEKLKHKKLEVI